MEDRGVHLEEGDLLVEDQVGLLFQGPQISDLVEGPFLQSGGLQTHQVWEEIRQDEGICPPLDRVV